MKTPDKVRAISRAAARFSTNRPSFTAREASEDSEQTAYPTRIVDLIIFHKLHLGLPAEEALKSYSQLTSEFVDWNETRVSSVREIQEAMGFCANSLELAVFIKDLLEFVHREHQDINLEFLAEMNLGDIRRYFKQVKGIDSSTVELVLHVRKEYPVLPLSEGAETVLTRLGLFHKHGRHQKEKMLHELIDPNRALTFHHFLLNHSREVCPPDETSLDCPRCPMRTMCAFYARTRNKNRKKSAAKRSGTRGKAVGSGRRARSGGRSVAKASGARKTRK